MTALGRPSGPTLAAFAAPSLALGALGLPVVAYLPEYYANALGLPLAAVGMAFMGVRLLDILLDPFIGAVMDRTRSRWGRFRPWLAASAPLLSLAAWMLFMAGPGVGPAYLWCWLLVLYTGVSICVLSHGAWAASLSPDYHQRTRIYAWSQAGNVVGLILVSLLPTALEMISHGDHASRIRAMGWFVVLLIPLAIAIAIARVPEPAILAVRHKSLPRDYLALLRRPTVRRILIADLLLGLAPGIIAALFFFYFERAKAFSKAEAATLLLAYLVAGLLGVHLWSVLARKIGKHRSLSAAGLLLAGSLAALALVPAGHFGLALAAVILAGLPYTAAPSLLRSMLADVVDEERLASGADRKGLLYAVLAATSKLGYALAVGVSFVALDLIGFQADRGGDPRGLEGLQLLFLVAPASCALVAAWACFGYPLDARRHAEIREKLARNEADLPDMAGRGQPLA